VLILLLFFVKNVVLLHLLFVVLVGLHIHDLATLLDHLVTTKKRNQNTHQDKEKDSHNWTSAKHSSGHHRNITKQPSTRGCIVAFSASAVARADAQVVQARPWGGSTSLLELSGQLPTLNTALPEVQLEIVLFALHTVAVRHPIAAESEHHEQEALAMHSEHIPIPK
jgi:hypothetical protein